MILVDTSVWIEAFRLPPALDVERLIDFDEIVTCLPVIQEVLQGFSDERAFRVAREAMLALPLIENPMSDGLFLEAVDLHRSARRAGITVRSSIDCLIAACALRHDLEVLHRDRDYTNLARLGRLRQRRV
ncbi:MAG: PIN domain-containing protein [Planctomycetota bacterium]